MNVHLVAHGSIVLLLSQLVGIVFARAINGHDPVRAGMWRMSHAACSAGAVFLIALAPVVPQLDFRPLPASLVVAAFIASTYLLCGGTLIAGATGQRGTRPGGPPANRIAFACYLAGALASTFAGLALAYAALSSLTTHGL